MNPPSPSATLIESANGCASVESKLDGTTATGPLGTFIKQAPTFDCRSGDSVLGVSSCASSSSAWTARLCNSSISFFWRKLSVVSTANNEKASVASAASALIRIRQPLSWVSFGNLSRSKYTPHQTAMLERPNPTPSVIRTTSSWSFVGVIALLFCAVGNAALFVVLCLHPLNHRQESLVASSTFSVSVDWRETSVFDDFGGHGGVFGAGAEDGAP
jgi:hypothetical protein